MNNIDQKRIEGLQDLRERYGKWREDAQKTREYIRDGIIGTDTDALNMQIDNLENAINNISRMISEELTAADRPAEK
jgi:hypothetical protein